MTTGLENDPAADRPSYPVGLAMNGTPGLRHLQARRCDLAGGAADCITRVRGSRVLVTSSHTFDRLCSGRYSDCGSKKVAGSSPVGNNVTLTGTLAWA
jgi:hypothetical protein